MLYQVETHCYDSTTTRLFEGPEVGDWKSYCRSLLHEATLLAISKDDDFLIGGDEIVDSLTEVLEKNGYHRVRPTTLSMFGMPVIAEPEDLPELPPESLSLVAEHNKRVQSMLHLS